MRKSRPALKRTTRRKTKRTTSPRRSAARSTFAISDTASWSEGKSFTDDWTSWHFPNWATWLAPYRNRAARMLEIGSWEGRSAVFFLNYLPRVQLTCLDSFEGGQEHQAASNATTFLPTLEGRFDANVAEFKPRVEKVKAHSAVGLAQLGVANRRFDIAYIDGSHRAADVYCDGLLTWALMAKGGLVFFDDYLWDEMPVKLDNPKPGIDAFLKAIKGQYRLVHKKYQIAIVKL